MDAYSARRLELNAALAIILLEQNVALMQWDRLNPGADMLGAIVGYKYVRAGFARQINAINRQLAELDRLMTTETDEIAETATD